MPTSSQFHRDTREGKGSLTLLTLSWEYTQETLSNALSALALWCRFFVDRQGEILVLFWVCWAKMQLFTYLSPAVSDASAKTKHHSFQHLISGKFGTLGDGWPWSFMEKMSNWQEVCKLRWQTALIVPQPKWVLCTCWVCLEPHSSQGPWADQPP